VNGKFDFPRFEPGEIHVIAFQAFAPKRQYSKTWFPPRAILEKIIRL